jgi:site-specific DNA-methyltransferase (adenine-specific)
VTAAVPRNTILIGDAADRLRSLPAGSVDCVVTSPPYFGLRNYQSAGQLGLETTVADWVTRLLDVTDQVARVLKPEGSLWLNVGDSYSRHARQGATAKGLLLAPERLLVALAGRGWIIRNKVVWAKPNPMPQSATDRLTASWEPLYFLVRSGRYHFDLDAIRTPHRSRRQSRRPRGSEPRRPGSGGRAPWAGPLAGDQSGLDRLQSLGLAGHPLGKNPADVWTIHNPGLRGGHHATYPEALLERPLRATCPERACVACGRAWRRPRLPSRQRTSAFRGELRPACGCGADWSPGLVLDPFIGSGTTAVVAQRLGRDWLGIEINPDFAALARARIDSARADPGRGKS